MKLFEYEAKSILQKYGVAVPRGKVAQTADEAGAIARELGKPLFVKSQITVSGRGKAGGILPGANADDAEKAASSLFGKKIEGLPVTRLLVEEKVDSRAQLYASVAIDRQARSFVALASTAGGMDIEEIARSDPRQIFRLYIDPLAGLSADDAAAMVAEFKLQAEESRQFATILTILFRVALDYDAELVELNPLVVTPSGAFCAVDARMTLDDNAIFRHPEFAERSLWREEDTPREAEARRRNFSYVDLDGDIGIVGNGAGLVMATLDMVYLYGGRPANFLDIGGGAQIEIIRDAILLAMGKPEVKAVLINILGGITRCDLVATGVIEALKTAPVKKPMAVRMMGTNEKEGQGILLQNGIAFYPDVEQAAAAIIHRRQI